MDFLKLISVSAGSVIALFVLTKLMGNKQMSQLSMFDYIIGISIGSIAAEMATELEKFWVPLAAMAVYALIAWCFSVLCSKSMAFRRIGFGRATLLYYDGKIYRQNLLRAKLDINEVLSECRGAGYFDLSELKAILLEPNGKLSFLPYAARRPLTPADMSIVPPESALIYNVIIDGKIMRGNLEAAGHNENWLTKSLAAQGIKSPREVFLATCDQNALTVYRRNDIPKKEDMFE